MDGYSARPYWTAFFSVLPHMIERKKSQIFLFLISKQEKTLQAVPYFK